MAKRLLLLNGLAIVSVILFHSAGFGFTAMFSWAHRYKAVSSPNYDQIGTAPYYAFRLAEQFTVFSIPAFVFVSGFFVAFLAGRTRTVDPKAIGARVKSLLVPYFLWSAIALLGLALQGRIFSGLQYVGLILTGATHPVYYFVPLLVQYYLLSPLIVSLVRWKWKLMLIATGLWQILVYLLQYPIVLGIDAPVVKALAAALPKWFFPVYLGWFTFGVVTGLQSETFRRTLDRLKWFLLSGVVVFFTLGFFEWELLLQASGQPWIENRGTLIDALYAASFILSFIAFSDVQLPFSESLAALGAKSYGIYLVHSLAMEYFSRSLYHFAPWVLGHQVLFQPMLITVGLAVPLVMMVIIRRSPSRTLYPSVFG